MGVVFIVTAIVLYSACMFFLILNLGKERYVAAGFSTMLHDRPIACFNCPQSIDPNSMRMMKLTTISSRLDQGQCYYVATHDEKCADAVNGMSSTGAFYGPTLDQYSHPTKMCTYIGPSTCPSNDVCSSSDAACIATAPCSTAGKLERTYLVGTLASNGGKKGCPSTENVDCPAPACVAAKCSQSDSACIATAPCAVTGKLTRTYAVTAPAANGGAGCPATEENVDCPAPACVAAKCSQSDSACIATAPCAVTGKLTRTYAVTTPAINGGAGCPAPEQLDCPAPACVASPEPVVKYINLYNNGNLIKTLTGAGYYQFIDSQGRNYLGIDNATTSIYVNAGTSARLYQHPSRSGLAITYGPGSYNLPVGLYNDLTEVDLS